MVFSGSLFVPILLFVGIGWLSTVTILVFRLMSHYNNLTKGTSGEELKPILDKILGGQGDVQGQIRTAEAAIRKIQEDSKFHLQKLGIVRFNPFTDTGGSQSFSMAILDENQNGIVITTLYTRTGSRWYLKEVAGGKGHNVELSREEEAAIKRALRNE